MKKHLTRLIAAFLAAVLLSVPASALTVDQALELLEEGFYYGLPDEAYEAETLDELIRLLGDPYTGYMSAEEYAAFLELVESTVDLVGIGVDIQYTEEGIYIVRVIPGSSAQEAGLQAGDLIVEVGGIPCVPANVSHRDMVVGEEGTRVTLTVVRGEERQNYTLTRRAIHVPNTQTTLLEGGVGYVDCDSFGADTGKLFSGGLEEYDDEVNCWLVDLRDNPGGYVDSALEMLAAVNGPGHYVYFEDKDGQVGAYAGYGQAATKKPLIVLVNGESASASELLAGGVRDTNRGIIIGSRTFGKGIAQAVLDETTDPEYFDGDCLKLTTARFYTIGGTTPQYIGVIPTLLVDDAYVDAVAAALCGGSEESSRLCVIPGTHPFYVDPEAGEDVIAALLEALPPQTPVFINTGVFEQCSPARAAQLLGLEYNSRWFSDTEGSPYAFAINAMGAYRLLNGTEPGVFSPEEPLTRAQLCVMLARVLNVTASGPSAFSDVEEDAWYAGEVNAMAALNLVNGVGDGRFDPEGALTQEEFLTVLGRTARYLNVALDQYGAIVQAGEDAMPEGVESALSAFSPWARSSAAVLAWGLEDAVGVRGDMLYAPLDRLDPSAQTLREEAAAGMYAMLAGLEILP